MIHTDILAWCIMYDTLTTFTEALIDIIHDYAVPDLTCSVCKEDLSRETEGLSSGMRRMYEYEYSNMSIWYCENCRGDELNDYNYKHKIKSVGIGIYASNIFNACDPIAVKADTAIPKNIKTYLNKAFTECILPIRRKNIKNASKRNMLTT